MTALTLTCPSCDARIEAQVPPVVADGGSDVGGRSELQGHDLRCRRCAHEFELLYY